MSGPIKPKETPNERPSEDMTTKSGKSIIILNSRNYPIVVNESGQTLGGGKFAKVSSSDKVVSRLIERDMVHVVS